MQLNFVVHVCSCKIHPPVFGFCPRFPEALGEQQGGLRPRRGDGGGGVVVLGEAALEDGDRLRAETSVPARWGGKSLQYSAQCTTSLVMCVFLTTLPEEESDVVARVGVAGVDGEGGPEVPLGLRAVVQHRRQVVVRQSVEGPQPDKDKKAVLIQHVFHMFTRDVR